MNFKAISSIFLGVGLIIIQALWGGERRYVLAFPGIIIICIAGLLLAVKKHITVPNLQCLITIILLSVWLLLRAAYERTWLSQQYIYLVLGCLVVYLIASTLNTPLEKLIVITFIIASAFSQMLLGIFQYFNINSNSPMSWIPIQFQSWYNDAIRSRAHGLYLSANHLVWLLNFSSIFIISMIYWGKIKTELKILFCYLFIINIAGIILTLSRGGILSCIIGILTFIIISFIILKHIYYNKINATKIYIGFFGLMFICLACFVAYNVLSHSYLVQYRLSNFFNEKYRLDILKAVFQESSINPLIGMGPGNFLYYARIYRPTYFEFDDIYAHNDWMQLFADFGYPAIALLVFCIFFHIKNGFNEIIYECDNKNICNLDNSRLFILIGSICVLIVAGSHSFFDFNMQVPANAFLISIACGFLAQNFNNTNCSFNVCKYLFKYIIVMLSLILFALIAINIKYDWQNLLAERALLNYNLNSNNTSEVDFYLKNINLRNPLLLNLASEYLLSTSSYTNIKKGLKFLSYAKLEAPLDYQPWLIEAKYNFKIGNLKQAGSAAIEANRLYPASPQVYNLYKLILKKITLASKKTKN